MSWWDPAASEETQKEASMSTRHLKLIELIVLNVPRIHEQHFFKVAIYVDRLVRQTRKMFRQVLLTMDKFLCSSLIVLFGFCSEKKVCCYTLFHSCSASCPALVAYNSIVLHITLKLSFSLKLAGFCWRTNKIINDEMNIRNTLNTHKESTPD